MKLIFLLGIVLWLSMSLEAQRKRAGRQVAGNRGRRCPGKQPFPLFPSCRDFNGNYTRKMIELRKQNKVGPGACKEDCKKCFLNDRNAVRCELGNGIPKECLQEIDDFLKGVNCTTPGG